MGTDKSHPWTVSSIDRLIIAHCGLPYYDEVVALRNDLRDAAKEVRRLMDELRVGNHLTATLTDRCRELETKGGKP